MLFKFSFLLFTAILATAATFQRPDGTTLTYYYDAPAQGQFPILVLLQGSTCTSAYPMYDSVRTSLGAKGIATLAIEKRGLTQASTECPQEYLMNNSFSDRILDYVSVVAHLRATETRWNHHIGWAGGSEGGVIASLVAPLVPETTLVALLASGGGMTMAEEMLLLEKQRLLAMGTPAQQIAQDLQSMQQQFRAMIADPSPNKEWLSDGKYARNTYKWWAIALPTSTINSLIALNVPIYMAHGTADTSCPFGSSEIVAQKFKDLGKSNLTFVKYDGLEHNWKDANGHPHPEVLQAALMWIMKNLVQLQN